MCLNRKQSASEEKQSAHRDTCSGQSTNLTWKLVCMAWNFRMIRSTAHGLSATAERVWISFSHTRATSSAVARRMCMCLSQVGVLLKRLRGWAFWRGACSDLSYSTLRFNEIRVLPQIRGTSLCNFLPYSWLWKFRHSISIVATFWYVSSTTVDVQCNKLATVVGGTKLTALATVDVRRWPWPVYRA